MPNYAVAITVARLAAAGLTSVAGLPAASAAERDTSRPEQSVPLGSAAQVAGLILPGVSGSASGGARHIFGLTAG